MGNVVPYALRQIRHRDLTLWTALVSPLLCAVSSALPKDIWALRGLKEKLKAGSALQLLFLCLPASLQGRVQPHPWNMQSSSQGKEASACNGQDPFTTAALLHLRCPQGCSALTPSLLSQNVVILDPLVLKFNCTLSFSPQHAEIALEICAD